MEDELFQKGISSGITKNLLATKRGREQFLSKQGIGGKAERAYQDFKENRTAILNNKRINPHEQQLAIAHAKKAYVDAGGAGTGTNYSPFYGSDTIDVETRATNIAQSINPTTIKKMIYDRGWVYDATMDRYKKGDVTSVTLEADMIKEIVKEGLENDMVVSQYLSNLETMNGIGKGESDSYLDDIATNMADRGERRAFNSINEGEFRPLKISRDVKDLFEVRARELGIANPFEAAQDVIERIADVYGMNDTRVVFTKSMKSHLAKGQANGREVEKLELPAMIFNSNKI